MFFLNTNLFNIENNKNIITKTYRKRCSRVAKFIQDICVRLLWYPMWSSKNYVWYILKYVIMHGSVPKQKFVLIRKWNSLICHLMKKEINEQTLRMLCKLFSNSLEALKSFS